MNIRDLLKHAYDQGASDLHITRGLPPVLRIDGELQKTTLDPLDRNRTKKLIYSLLDDEREAQFEEERELDFSLQIPDVGRFRVNVHRQKGCVEAAFRLIPRNIPSLDELGLPPVARTFTELNKGLVLVTGPTGVGKTTTQAAMLNRINREMKKLMITIEDPIEYVHDHDQSIVKQREVGSDTPSFASALKHALRQDPDVLLVGEMRDLETIETTITAAETGHLVISTLHTPDAPQTVDRLVDVFPPYQQDQVRVQLAGCLEGILSQKLLMRSDGEGRVLAPEILVATSGIRNMIRDERTQQILSAMQTGGQHGMRTLDESLKELYQAGEIDYDTAVAHARSRDRLEEA